jgi:uncharacterized DUF497 family protein
MVLRITWDPSKALENFRKHGVTFKDAADVLGDPFHQSMPDDLNSDEDDRYTALGSTAGDKLLFVSYTIRGDDARVISARTRDTLRTTTLYE